jgi:hypothetical protein
MRTFNITKDLELIIGKYLLPEKGLMLLNQDIMLRGIDYLISECEYLGYNEDEYWKGEDEFTNSAYMEEYFGFQNVLFNLNKNINEITTRIERPETCSGCLLMNDSLEHHHCYAKYSYYTNKGINYKFFYYHMRKQLLIKVMKIEINNSFYL